MQDGNGKREGAIQDAVRLILTIRALIERGASTSLIDHELDRLDAALRAIRVTWDRGEGASGETAGQGEQTPGED